MNIVVAMLLTGSALAQSNSSRDWASLIGQRFTVEREVPYWTVTGVTLKLDYYVPYKKTPGPTVIYIHGGGWQTFSKEQTVLWYLPYLELGMRVVAVQYRLSGVAAAPAGAEDCACAIRYIYEHAAERAIDPTRVLLTGGSAGGHLVLLTGFGSIECPDHPGPLPRPTAILNYYGPADPPTLEDTKALKRWLRDAPVDGDLARRLSPLNAVKPGLPPVLTIHGDADEMVPYTQATRLHAALEKAGVSNRLVTISGGHHGRHTWTDEDTLRVQREIEKFLVTQKILTERK